MTTPNPAITIPLTRITPGNNGTFGPVTVDDSVSSFSVLIDRTVTGGFNSVPSGAQASMTVYQSNDGGATWIMNGACTFIGDSSGNFPESGFSTSLFPGTSRQLKVEVDISGFSVSVQGSLSVS